MLLDQDTKFSLKAQKLISWGHWFVFFNFVFVFVISTTYFSAGLLPTTSIGWFYLLFTWIGHTAFICFAFFILTIFPASLAFPYNRHIRGLCAILATAGVSILVIDAYSYTRLGYHISNASMDQVLTLLTVSYSDHKLSSTLWVLGFFSAILSFELIISNYTWKRVTYFEQQKWPFIMSIFLVFCFVGSHLLHIWADAKLNYDVTKQDNTFPLSYPMTAKTLLAKYGFSDINARLKAKGRSFSKLHKLIYQPPKEQVLCHDLSHLQPLTLVYFDAPISKQQQQRLQQAQYIRFDKHYQSTLTQDALFNLWYGLPAIYLDSIQQQQLIPLWLHNLQQAQLGIELTTEQPFPFTIPKQDKDIPIIAKIKLMSQPSEQEITQLIQSTDPFQIIIARTPQQKNVLVKSPLWVKWPNMTRYRRQVTQNSAISYSLLADWQGCELQARQHQLAHSLFMRQPNQLQVNFTQSTIIAIKKDVITLVNLNANIQNLSATNGFILQEHTTDIYTLVQAIKQLTTFEK